MMLFLGPLKPNLAFELDCFRTPGMCFLHLKNRAELASYG